MKDTEKKTALVVGGSTGIGFHTAARLADMGYSVYNASRGAAEYDVVRNLTVDVEISETIDAAVDELWQKEGRIDVLVYSAGYSMAAPVEHAKQKDIQRLFEVNYFGAVKFVRKVLPYMKAGGGGKIIFISSMGGVFPIAFDAFYSSSKAALDMLARALAIEVEPFGIYVTSVQPGGVSTRFTFKRNVYESDEVGEYADRMTAAVEALAKAEQDGLDPETVADEVVSVIKAAKPPVTCAVGIKNKTFKLAQKILPEKISEAMNRNMYE